MINNTTSSFPSNSPIQPTPETMSNINQPQNPTAKRNLFRWILGAAIISVMVVIGMYYFVWTKPFLTPSIRVTKSEEDEIIKSGVNRIQAYAREYYVDNGSYPKNLAEFETILGKDERERRRYTNPPYYFKSDGETYDYYGKLNNGQIFRGDSAGINKWLDTFVRVEVKEITTAVDLHYHYSQRLPEILEEISKLPELSDFKLKKNPVTGNPYTYTIVGEREFSVSGQLSTGEEYKLPL